MLQSVCLQVLFLSISGRSLHLLGHCLHHIKSLCDWFVLEDKFSKLLLHKEQLPFLTLELILQFIQLTLPQIEIVFHDLNVLLNAFLLLHSRHILVELEHLIYLLLHLSFSLLQDSSQAYFVREIVVPQ